MAIAINDIKVQPWQEARHGWRGELISADGTSTKDFLYNDVDTADLVFGANVEAILPYLSDRAKALFN